MNRISSASVFLIILGMMAASCVDSYATPNRVKLIFSLDQGFGNGVVVHNDQLAVRRIIWTIKPLTRKYDVYMLLNPQVKDKQLFENTLDTLKKHGMPFVLDVYTSDAYTLGSSSTQNAPYDPSHALSASIDYLKHLKMKYGDCFAGIRFAEVFGQDFTVRCIKTTNPEWARPSEILPEDNVFNDKYAEPLLKFAHDNNMFVQWGDFHWYGAASWDSVQKDYEEDMKQLLMKYPDTVIVVYDNNEPNEDSVDKLNTWHAIINDFVRYGAKGCGLSDQSWIRADHMSTKPEEIVAWAKSALDNDCVLIQFEPVWYFFRLPVGTFEIHDYTNLPEWKNRGYGTRSYYILQKSLLQHKTQ